MMICVIDVGKCHIVKFNFCIRVLGRFKDSNSDFSFHWMIFTGKGDKRDGLVIAHWTLH